MDGAYLLGIGFCGYGILTGTMSYGNLMAIMQLVGQVQSPFAKENVQMKSKALSIVVLLLAVVLLGLLFVNHRQEQRQTAYMQQLQKEAIFPEN